MKDWGSEWSPDLYYRMTRNTRSGAGNTSSSFSPISLAPFIWYDPSDLSTLFQDAAGTTPVIANNDPVGRVNDKSGNGFHLTQATAAARPLYKTSGGLRWLEFDGIDDQMLTADFAYAQSWDRVSGIRQLGWTDNDAIFGPNSNGSTGGFLFPTGASPALALFDGSVACSNSGAAINNDAVAVERHAGASSRLGIDAGAYSTGDPGGAGTDGLALGVNLGSGGFANFRFYGLVQFNRTLTDGEIVQLRTYLAAKQGRIL